MTVKTANGPKGNKLFDMAEVVNSRPLAGTGDFRGKFPAQQHPGLGMGIVQGTLTPGGVSAGVLLGVPIQQTLSQLVFQQMIGAGSVLADGLTMATGWLMHFLLGRTSFTLGLALSTTAPFLADGTQYLISWLSGLFTPSVMIPVPAPAPAPGQVPVLPMTGRDIPTSAPLPVRVDASVVRNVRKAA